MTNAIAGVALLLLLLRPATALPNTGQRGRMDGSLAGYVAFAMENSPVLEAQFERWQAEVHRIAKARRLPDPVLTYAYYVRRVETRVGPQRHRLSLRQTFPWPTTLTRGSDAASARARSAQERFDAMALSLAAAVAKEYWTLWAVEAERTIHEVHLHVLTGLSESAAAQVMTGRIDLADQQQIDLASSRVEDLIGALDERTARAEARLRGIIGASHSVEIEVTSAPQMPDSIPDEEALLAAISAQPFISSHESLSRASGFAAQKTQAERWPNISIGVDWIETGESSMPDVAHSGKDALMVGVGFSLPLWQRNYKEEVAAHRSQERAHRADAATAKAAATVRLYETLSQLRDARRRVSLYEGTLVPQAQTVFESVLGAYISGRGAVASVLLAQGDLLELRIERIRARADYSRAMARLEALIGQTIVSMTRTEKKNEAK